MGKNKSKAKNNNQKSNKVKFIIVGFIAAIIIAGISAATIGNTSNSGDSIDTSKGSPILGSPSAPVTIIEFGDYQCPFCQKWNQNTKPLIEEKYINTGKAKLIYIDFPILGPDSINAHAGSYCADEQGLYWQYHDFLYENQGHENDGWASSQNLKSLVSKMDGLDAQAFGQCLDSGKYEDRVKENKNVALRSGAQSTPSFIVIDADGEDTQITGAHPYETFETVIEKMSN